MKKDFYRSRELSAAIKVLPFNFRADPAERIGYDDAKDSTAFPQPAGYSLLSFLVYHNFL